MKIPTYNEKITPDSQEQGVFHSGVLRESPRQIAETSATAKAKQGFGKTLTNIGLDMKEAYNAKQLADAETNLAEQYAELENRMKSPEYQKENHWESWAEHYDKEARRISNDVAKRYKTIGFQARSNLKNTADRYKTQYGVRNNERTLNAQMDELELGIIKHQKEETALTISNYVNGNMNAMAEGAKRYTSYLAGQVQAGIISEEEAFGRDGKLEQFESNVISEIWEYRTTNEPGKAYKELTQMKEDYLLASKNGMTKIMGLYGMDLSKISHYTEKAKAEMMSLLKQNDSARKEADKKAKEDLKVDQAFRARKYYLAAQNNNWSKIKISDLDRDYKLGLITEEDYKSIRAVARTTGGKKAGDIKQKDLLITAYEMLSKNKPIGDWIQANKEELTEATLKDLVKKNGDRQYKRGLSVIEEKLRPHPLDNRTGAKQKRAKFVVAVLEYDKLLTANQDKNKSHTDLALEAVLIADPATVLTPEQEKQKEAILRERDAVIEREKQRVKDGTIFQRIWIEEEINKKYNIILKNKGLK